MNRFILRSSGSLLLLFILTIYSIETKAQAKYPTLLWEINHEDLKEPSYLYGTMHVSNKVAFNLGEPFFDALESVDQVALELEPEDWFREVLDGDIMSSSMRYGGGLGLSDFYGSRAWNEFEERFEYPENINLKIQESFRTSPRMINQLLFRFYDPSGNFEEETWLDMYIYQCARKLGKSTFGLETFEESMEYMRKAQEENRKNRKGYSQTDYQSRMEAREEIENAYRKGDLDLLDSLSLQLNEKGFTKYILIERNKQFVRGMDSLMQIGPLFTGVGAAHLPGEEGCIEMLRALGYTVEPIKPGKRDTERKDELSESIMKRSLSEFTSQDGRVSFTVPYEAYELTADPRNTSYFSMDIPNGLTFMLDVMVSGNSFEQKDREYLNASLDSMLFEIIPGDIEEQKPIRISGYKGVDVIHKVSRGDINRSVILFSDQEVIIARLAGSGEKVLKGAGAHYFKSLKLKLENDADWRTVKAPWSTFEVEMPGKLIDYSKHKATILGGDVLLEAQDANGAVYQVHRLQDMDKGYIDDERYLLDKVSKAFEEDYDVERESMAYKDIDGRNTLWCTYPAGERTPKTYGRYVKIGNEIIALHAFTADSSDADRFLQSLKISAPLFETYHELVDSSAFFKTKIPWEKEKNYFERMFNMERLTPEREETLDAYRYGTGINPPGSNDVISVYYERLGRYEQMTESKDEFIEELEEDLTDEGDLIIDDKQIEWSDNGYRIEYQLSDSLSDYRYKRAIVMEGSRQLKIEYGYDANQGESDLYGNFMEHLELLEDTLSRDNYFDKEPTLLIADLQSEDTLYFEMASNFLEDNYSISDEWEYAIGKALKAKCSPLADKEDKEHYEELYNKNRYLGASESMIAQLSKEYKDNPDSAAYQKEILTTLTRMQTKKAHERMKSLLLNDPPVGVSMSNYSGVFGALNDSLELMAEMYPDFMILTEYEEYKDALLHNLRMLVDSGAINMKRLKKHRGYLERQAKIEFKRFRSTGYDVTDNYGYRSGADILDYWSILWPWRDKSGIAELYRMAEESSKEEVRQQYALFKIEKGEKLSDAEIKQLRPKDDVLEDYEFLEQIERLDLFPDTIDIEYEYVKHLIETKFTDYVSDWDQSEVDSIELVSTRVDSIRTHGFKTYLMKSLLIDDDVETQKLHVILIDQNTKVPNISHLEKTDEASELKSEEDQFDLMLKNLIDSNRKYPRSSYDYYGY